MRVVITGGGVHWIILCTHLLNNHNSGHESFEIVVVDKLTYASNVERIPQGVEFIEKDICDLTKEDIGEVQYIVNFMAESHVDNSIDGMVTHLSKQI